MVKSKSTIYICESCGGEHSNWEGKCRFCGNWNSLKEFKYDSTPTSSAHTRGDAQTVKTFQEINSLDQKRIVSGINEFDRVLGGGIVKGSIILLGGDPGIGKSTLVLQIASILSKNDQNILYISGEESLAQIKIRASRTSTENSPISILNETSLPNIFETIKRSKPNLVIIDSIQTMYHPDFPSTPGSIVQVRECSLRLQQFAKKENITIILVGHITKDGTVAGPKTLEHLVDVVLYLEGERYHNIRVLRSIKNRFGDISESGLFEMRTEGLVELNNPSEIFLSEKIDAPGSVVTATLEGRRPILVEIQALVKKSVFGYPKRASSGFDNNRLQLLIAVLERRANLDLNSFDVYVNVIGGIKISEPAADLAIVTAIASATKGVSIQSKQVVWGEVGLVGEIRRVVSEKQREHETTKLGYKFLESKTTINEFLHSINIL